MMLRGVLGNASSMKAYREGTPPFPDRVIIADLLGNTCRWPGSTEPSSPCTAVPIPYDVGSVGG
jgi:hypothetical protein